MPVDGTSLSRARAPVNSPIVKSGGDSARGRRRVVTFQFAIRVGSEWVTRVKQGVVTLGSAAHACRFESAAAAWAELARESAPIPVLLAAQVELLRDDIRS